MFSNPEENTQFLKIIKIFSKIYHKNVLRYYNAWFQKPNMKKTISYGEITALFPEIEEIHGLYKNKSQILLAIPKENIEFIKYYLQVESPIKSLLFYCSEHRKDNENKLLLSYLKVYEQAIDGIAELFRFGLRQKNILDFENVFVNEQNEIKLGNLKDLEFCSNLLDNTEFKRNVLKDIQSFSYKLFFEENPYCRKGTIRRDDDLFKRIEEFFKEMSTKGEGFLYHMDGFFQVYFLIYFFDFYEYLCRKLSILCVTYL